MFHRSKVCTRLRMFSVLVYNILRLCKCVFIIVFLIVLSFYCYCSLITGDTVVTKCDARVMRWCDGDGTLI